MALIQKTGTLLKRTALINLAAPQSNQITTLISGSHGIGKTASVSQTAKELNGYVLLQDGSTTKEGELPGLPLASENKDGSKEIMFVKHKVISAISRLEEAIYHRAKNEGFLNGRVKLLENGDISYKLKGSKEAVIIPAKEEYASIIAGEDNKFKFGTDLPLDIKLELIRTVYDKDGKVESLPEIPLLFFFIDEMNRTDEYTMKELMNIVLTRNINGYVLPWWVSMTSAINPATADSSYKVNDFDGAQLDRFLIINTTTNANEFINYGLDSGMSSEMMRFIAEHPDALQDKEHKSISRLISKPSPRSWEQVDLIGKYIDATNTSDFFTAEERKEVAGDKLELWSGKVGDSHANMYTAFLRKASDHIKPEEILNGKTGEIDPKVKQRFGKLSNNAAKLITVRETSTYIINKYDELHKLSKENPKEFAKWLSQIGEFLSVGGMLTQDEIMVFVKPITTNHIKLVLLIGKAFSAEVSSMHAQILAERKFSRE